MVMQYGLLSKPRDSTSVLEALPGNLDIKIHSPSIFNLADFTVNCQLTPKEVAAANSMINAKHVNLLYL